MIRDGSLKPLRAIPLAVAVGLFGVALTGAIVMNGGVEAEIVLVLQLLFVRLLPYAEIVFAAFLLDKFFRDRAVYAVTLASTVLILVDVTVTYRLFWQPQVSSTDGVFGVLAMIALVLILIPGSIIVGLWFTRASAEATPRQKGDVLL